MGRQQYATDRSGCSPGDRRLVAPHYLVAWAAVGVPVIVGQDRHAHELLDRETDCVGAWSNWSECDVECGGGVRERTFAVHRPAREGGRLCPAADGDIERELSSECMAPCPVDCAGVWSDWTACSAQCGGGVRSRTFSVAVAPVGDGAVCEAEDMGRQEKSCNVEGCDTVLDCIGSWGSWSPCSVACGGGTRSRRYAIETRQQNGGSAATCDIEASRTTSQVETCNDHACPVDCRGEWGSFTGCDDPCANNAMAERRYHVTIPAAFGNRVETYTTNYTALLKIFLRLILLIYKRVRAKRNCCLTPSSAVHSLGVGGRAATCVANDGAIQRVLCDRSSCPMDCVGHWEEWEDCSVSCGDGGYRKRTYVVNQQALNGGSATTCEAQAGTEEFTDYGCNADVICPVDCEGSFGGWSECSAKCGNGTQTRTYNVTTVAAHGGRTDTCLYPRNTVERQECINNSACPIDCIGAWSAWSDCSTACGIGTKRQVYHISVVAALGGNESTCEASNGQSRETSCDSGPCLPKYRPNYSKIQTEVSDSRGCNLHLCIKPWHWAAGASVLLCAVVMCICTYSKHVGQIMEEAEQTLDGYTVCQPSEEQMCNPDGSILHATSDNFEDSLMHRSLRLSIHGPGVSGFNLSPASVNKISPPTKAELDQQIMARASRNPDFAAAVSQSPYLVHSTGRSRGTGDAPWFDRSMKARSLQDAFDVETRSLVDEDSGDLERPFDAETTARSRTVDDGSDNTAVAAMSLNVVDQLDYEEERSVFVPKSARSSREERQLMQGSTGALK